MYRMLIVDDEIPVREGIRRMLRWPDYDIEICGEAANGFQALELMKKYKPDFVLTDIKMPEMDGLELLEKVKKQGFESKMIVLSGYNDFVLVKQAMKLGAVDYLLKPAGRGELLQLIEEQLMQKGGETLFAAERNRALKTAENSFFNRIISNTITALEFREKQELFEIDFGTASMAVARLEAAEMNETPVNKMYSKTELLELCQMFLEEHKRGYAFFNLSGGIVCILTDIWEKDIHLGCEELLENLLQIIHRKFSNEMFLTVSRPVKSYRNLWRAYQEAEQTLKYKFVFDTAQILFAGEIESYYHQETETVLIKEAEIEELVRKGTEEKFTLFLGKILGGTEEVRYTDTYVYRNRAMEIIIFIFHFLMEQFTVDRAKLTKEMDETLNQLAKTVGLNETREFLMKLFRRSSRYYEENNAIEYSKIVSDAVDRIKENFGDIDLSLQYLAEEFDVNAAYLGRIFKKETGTSFANYLNSYRIKAAVQLLKETNKKGSEIYKLVGFSNYNYFYIVFKKLTGKNPMEIRE